MAGDAVDTAGGGSGFAVVRADGLIVHLRVTPRASRNEVGQTVPTAGGGARLRVSVTAAPDGGKANEAVIVLLARRWRLPKSAIRIVRGAAERDKTLHVAGDPALLLRLVCPRPGC